VSNGTVIRRRGQVPFNIGAMAKTTPPSVVPDNEPEYNTVTVLDREIKIRRLNADQILAADMMARRLQRLTETRKEDGSYEQEDWQRFLNGTRRLLDWISGQFAEIDDLEWFEDKMLSRELGLEDMGPIMEAMGMPAEAKPANRRARRAK
jgi:hypothetical protein